MGGHSFHDVINHKTCQVNSMAVDAEYGILQFLVVERTLLTLHSTV